MTKAGPEDVPLEGRNVAPLRLLLTHSHGEPRSKTLHISPEGAGMAEALAQCGEREDDAQWRLANLCRIQWSDGARCWQLLNNSYTLMCVHNGERVRSGCPVRLAYGDLLELGLLRFMVQPWEASTREGRSRAPVVGSVAEGRESAEQPAPGFGLSDLAAYGGSSGTMWLLHGGSVDRFFRSCLLGAP
ncbi:hypothetical protein VLK31_07975 [Variovorax sp. H27-G14]|uniref:hypothetical protein n=1 Tax=Variovorax sp. H27-G14 TaxID=3111914 RepID=UPI0038FC6C8F